MKLTIILRYLCFFLLVNIAVYLSASKTLSNESAPVKVSLQLPWKHQFQFAGFYAALEKGFYKSKGLDLTILPFKPGINIIDEVMKENANYGLWDTEVIAAYLNGRDIVLLANFFKRSPLVFAVKPDIFHPSELKGKKIMANPHEIYGMNFKQMFVENGISPKDLIIVPHSFNIEPFVRNEVDAMSMYITNEAYSLNKQRIPYNIIDPSNYGIELLSGNLFTREKEFENHPDRVRAFREASIKGWKYALSHPNEIINLILEKYSDRKTREALDFEAREIRKIILPAVHSVGEVDKKRVERLADLFIEFGLVRGKRSLDDFFMNNNSMIIHLTHQEKQYLQEKKVLKMCVDPDFMPFEKIDKNGRYLGLGSDYLGLVSEKIGIPIQLIPTKSWARSLELAGNGECDILFMMNPTPDRRRIFNFTIPYLTTPLVAVARTKTSYIKGLNDLSGKTLALVKGYSVEEQVRNYHKDIELVHVENVEEAMRMVSRGKVYATVTSIIEAGYYIKHLGLTNIKIAGDMNIDYDLCTGIQKNEPVLKTILNKAIESMTEKEKNDIFSTWIAVKYEHGFDYILFFEMIAVFAIVSLILGVINFQTRRHNRELKELNSQLDNAKNMLRLVIDNVPQLIFWKDINFVYQGCNQSFSKIAGMHDSEDITGKTDADLIWEKKDLLYLRNTDKEIIESNAPIYHEVKSRKLPDRSRIWLDINKIPLHDLSGNVVGILGSCEDITQKKLSEFKIKQSEEKYRTILESIRDGYCEIDTKGIITLVNRYACTMTGYEKHELEGMNFVTFLEKDPGKDFFKSLWKKLVKEANFMQDISFTIVRKDGKIKHVETSGTVIRKMDGRIIGARSIVRDVDQRKSYEKKLLNLAYHDSLTGLNNRKAFYNKLNDALKRAERYEYQVALFFIDIDKFKKVNDTFGHEAGDKLLIEIARRLTSLLRETDIVSRIGGDEFTLLLEMTKNMALKTVAEKIVTALAKPYKLGKVNVDYVSASIGISCYPDDSQDLKILISQADEAMYKAKEQGNTYIQYSDNNNAAVFKI